MEILDKVEQSGKWPQRACTTMFFLIPKNVRSETPIALMPTLIRWWEALRAPEVVKWQQTYRVEWDATDDRNGGAQRTEREKIKELWLVLDLAKAFERGSLQLPKEDLAGAVCVFRAPEASAV